MADVLALLIEHAAASRTDGPWRPTTAEQAREAYMKPKWKVRPGRSIDRQ
jgi:hypothetical protein